MPLGGRIMSGSGGSRQVEVMCLDVGRAWPSAGGLGQRSLGPCPSSKRPVRKAQHGLPTVPPLVFVLQIVCSLAGRAMGPRPGPRGVLSPSLSGSLLRRRKETWVHFLWLRGVCVPAWAGHVARNRK